jgi:hypothetical protein
MIQHNIHVNCGWLSVVIAQCTVFALRASSLRSCYHILQRCAIGECGSGGTNPTGCFSCPCAGLINVTRWQRVTGWECRGGGGSCKIILNVYGNERRLAGSEFKDRLYAECVW